VIAAMVGTWGLLPPSERQRIRGTIINKFRGDVRLFGGGRQIIADRSGWADCGVVPFFHELRYLPSEDGIDLRYYERKPGALIKIAVPIFPRISNFDDFDPLNAEPNVEVQMIEPGRALPGDADLDVLPGSKSTIADLRFLRETGWDVDLRAHLRRGGQIVGICGGYQMLGRVVDDPEGVEGPPERIDGLGFLDVETRLTSSKILSPVSGRRGHDRKIDLGLRDAHGRDGWARLRAAMAQARQ
jgi:adenosylcobyric acid synthase